MRPNSTLFCILLLIVFNGLAHIGRADFTVTKLGDSLVDAKALTISGPFGQAINGLAFQQDAVASHKNYQYVGYYDGRRQVCLARRKLPAGDWQSIRFKDYHFKSNDAHNTISIGICPKDGTIHLAFDHHGHPLHYRASGKYIASEPEKATWDTSVFGPITSEVEKGKPIRITYPRFWQTPDGGSQFCYRTGGSGNGDRWLVDYNPKSGTWTNTRKIDSGAGPFEDARDKSGSRCSYPNGYDYGPFGKLHATWVWRESTQGGNHDLMYAYSEDRGKTWFNNKAKPLDGPPHVNSPDITVVGIPRTLGLGNTFGQAVDSQGRIHAVIRHSTEETLKSSKLNKMYAFGPPDAGRHHHYWRDKQGIWHHTELPWIVLDGRPKLFIDADDNAYLIYQDVICGFTRNQEQGWFLGINYSAGNLVIAGATAAGKWTDWKVIHTERGPFVNEMVGDNLRWQNDGILSVMVQEAPKVPHDPTALRIVDFSLKEK